MSVPCSRKWVAKECRRVGHSVSTVQGSFVNLEPANDLTFREQATVQALVRGSRSKRPQ